MRLWDESNEWLLDIRKSRMKLKHGLVMRIAIVAIIILLIILITFICLFENPGKLKPIGRVIEYPKDPRNFSYFVIDEDFDCELIKNGSRKIQIAVNIISNNSNIRDDPRFDIIYFEDSPNKDYLEFHTWPKRIIPKNFEVTKACDLIVPKNRKQFMDFWKRSTFIECVGLNLERKEEPYLEGPLAAGSLARVRDELQKFGIFAILNGGTLLGWYRECTVIPHTSDMDVAIIEDQYDPIISEWFKSNQSEFNLRREFGRDNDSKEFTVALKTGYSVSTDIFLMYDDKYPNGTFYSWVGGTSDDGTKYRYTYPKYNPWCSADLHGHIFWVTCTPNQMIVNEYGPEWYKDHPTRSYSWSSSHFNVKPHGNWSAEEMKEIYHIYY